MKRKTTIKKTISDYLRSKNANVDDVKILIEKCNNWLINCKTKQIESIDKQIGELNKQKEEIMNL